MTKPIDSSVEKVLCLIPYRSSKWLLEHLLEQEHTDRKTVAWIGDGNNMCNSYIEAAMQFDFQLKVACPAGYEPDARFLAQAGERVQIVRNPREAVAGAHLVSTDVWASMGQEDEAEQRMALFRPYQVTRELLDAAAEDVLFMHCLPAHRGEEISFDLLDDPRSVAWDQAENRLHAQKALLEMLVEPAYHHA